MAWEVAMGVHIRRAYDPPAADDGTQVLVDRLWPRGVSREAARVDRWLKEVAPSDGLRRWFGHDPARWEEFDRRYRQELEAPPARDALEALVALVRQGPVTLVYGARDQERNNAVVLWAVLDARLG